jgi:hypothetical protein
MIREIRYAIAEETLPLDDPETYAARLTASLEARYPDALVVIRIDPRHSTSQLIIASDDVQDEDEVQEHIKHFYDHYDEPTI